MAARVGLVTGKEYVVDGSVDEVFGSLTGKDPHTVLTVDDGGAEKRVYVFRAHVAYVEDETPSVYEDRGIISV
jgi:hypothetical protein